MDEIVKSIEALVGGGQVRGIIRGSLILFVGFVLSGLISSRVNLKFIPTNRLFLIKQFAKYGIVGLSIVWALREFGFDLSVLLGAAGILTVAFGFASQTSASNLISGFFLMGEQPFRIGDTIKVADVIGEILSIDPLSVKLRTFDNLMVRIPNETMLKSNITNLTKFPIRRIDLEIGVSYSSDLSEVEKVLLEVVDKNTLCLEEPKPAFAVLAYGESSINLRLSAWTKRESYWEQRTKLYKEVKTAFAKHGLEIPFPQRVLHSPGPIEVRVLGPEASIETSSDSSADAEVLN